MAVPITRFPLRFDAWYRALSSTLLLPPSKAYVEVQDDRIAVRMAWAFRAEFPRAAVRAASELHKHPLSRGVHGWGGRWLVNGSGDRIVVIDLQPSQHGFVAGFPVRLRQLMVSVEEPERLIALLTQKDP